MGADYHADDEGGRDDQQKLTPLPSRAYAKRPHGDQLLFPEETGGGDGDPLSESSSAQSVIVQDTISPRLHGESSLFTFTNGLSEKWKFTSRHDLRSCRREFWETPKVWFKWVD